jgi:hypothetical protein
MGAARLLELLAGKFKGGLGLGRGRRQLYQVLLVLVRLLSLTEAPLGSLPRLTGALDTFGDARHSLLGLVHHDLSGGGCLAQRSLFCAPTSKRQNEASAN